MTSTGYGEPEAGSRKPMGAGCQPALRPFASIDSALFAFPIWGTQFSPQDFAGGIAR